MTYEQVLEEIYSLRRFGRRPGLARMRRLMEALGNPQRQVKWVHVAGTNGKGSTTRMTASVLEAAGYKTGLFISPFVVDFTERIQVNSRYITREQVTAVYEKIEPLVQEAQEAGDPFATFEVITAMAFCHFANEGCQIGCLEVGMGGRFDATNIIEEPLVTAITAIGLDHTAVLGSTVEAIAAEKCGIIKPGVPVVCYPLQKPEVLGVIMERAAAMGAEVHIPNYQSVKVEQPWELQPVFCYGGAEFRLSLAGDYQIGNAVTAVEICRTLTQRGIALEWRHIVEGVSGARFPGRFEKVHNRPLVVLDGAHNPSGTEALLQGLAQVPNRPKIGLFGVAQDKDRQQMAALLQGHFDRVVCVTPPVDRGFSGSELAALLQAEGIEAEACEDVLQGLKKALLLAGEEGAVVGFGSLFLVTALRKLFMAE